MPDARVTLNAEITARFRLIEESYPALTVTRARLDQDRATVVLFLIDPADRIGRDFANLFDTKPTGISIGVLNRKAAAEVCADEHIKDALATEIEAGRVRVLCIAHGGMTLVDSRLDRSPDQVRAIVTTGWRSRFLEPQNLMLLGAEMLPHTFAQTENPTEAMRLWVERVEQIARTDPRQAVPWTEWIRESVTLGVLVWAARWASCAFPQILPSSKLAASLMATTVGPDSADLLALPWTAFLIEVPEGLLSGLEALSGTPRTLDLLLVATSADGGLHVMLASRHHDLALHHPARSLAELALGDVLNDTSRKEPAFFGLEDHDQRALLLAGRLVVGVALELASEGHLERRTRGPGSRARRQGLPKAWTFELRRDVRLDVRTPIREFVQGRRGASPQIQTLVRGHWKRQPHGPASELRKVIHVEPYWRGPEDAPIAVRAHRMRSPEGGDP